MAHLSVSQSARTATVNITTDGSVDWMKPSGSGPDTFDRKSGGGSLISTLTYTPDAHAYNSVLGDQLITWSDGTPTGSGSNDGAMYNYGNFSFTVPADTSAQRLRIYAGVNTGLAMTCTASLSDASVADQSATYSGTLDCMFEVQFSAASGGQTLTISLTRSVSDYQYFAGASLSAGTGPSGKPSYYYGNM